MTISRADSATVIVVTEDAVVGAAITAELAERGVDAVAVHAVHQALRLAATRPPVAWIVDQALLGLTGAELVRSLRGSPRAELRRAGVIGTSTDAGHSAVFAAAGADAFVQQPAPEHAFALALEPLLVRAAIAASVP